VGSSTPSARASLVSLLVANNTGRLVSNIFEGVSSSNSDVIMLLFESW
jgi:hypothetical protein